MSDGDPKAVMRREREMMRSPIWWGRQAEYHREREAIFRKNDALNLAEGARLYAEYADAMAEKLRGKA